MAPENAGERSFEFLHVQGIDTTRLESFLNELPTLSFNFQPVLFLAY